MKKMCVSTAQNEQILSNGFFISYKMDKAKMIGRRTRYLWKD